MGAPEILRPDVTKTIGGASYTLRASFDAIEAIERRLDIGLPRLLGRLGMRDVRFTDCVVVLEESSRAAGKPLSRAQAAELVQLHFADASAAVIEVIAKAFGPAPEDGQENPPKAS